jgi:DNA-binding NarL/FixJ family response regulator
VSGYSLQNLFAKEQGFSMETASILDKLLNVAIVDEDSLYALPLIKKLKQSKTIAAVRYFKSAKLAISPILKDNPDVVLIALKFSCISGIGMIRRIREAGFDGQIIVVSDVMDDDLLFNAFRAGAIGFLLKREVTAEEILNAMVESVTGGVPVAKDLLRRTIENLYQKRLFPRQHTEPLSQRERQILLLISKGHSCREIASIFSISYHTVRTHQKNLYKKLNVSSVTEALAKLYRAG